MNEMLAGFVTGCVLTLLTFWWVMAQAFPY